MEIANHDIKYIKQKNLLRLMAEKEVRPAWLVAVTGGDVGEKIYTGI